MCVCGKMMENAVLPGHARPMRQRTARNLAFYPIDLQLDADHAQRYASDLGMLLGLRSESCDFQEIRRLFRGMSRLSTQRALWLLYYYVLLVSRFNFWTFDWFHWRVWFHCVGLTNRSMESKVDAGNRHVWILWFTDWRSSKSIGDVGRCLGWSSHASLNSRCKEHRNIGQDEWRSNDTIKKELHYFLHYHEMNELNDLNDLNEVKLQPQVFVLRSLGASFNTIRWCPVSTRVTGRIEQINWWKSKQFRVVAVRSHIKFDCVDIWACLQHVCIYSGLQETITSQVFCRPLNDCECFWAWLEMMLGKSWQTRYFLRLSLTYRYYPWVFCCAFWRNFRLRTFQVQWAPWDLDWSWTNGRSQSFTTAARHLYFCPRSHLFSHILSYIAYECLWSTKFNPQRHGLDSVRWKLFMQIPFKSTTFVHLHQLRFIAHLSQLWGQSGGACRRRPHTKTPGKRCLASPKSGVDDQSLIRKCLFDVIWSTLLQSNWNDTV